MKRQFAAIVVSAVCATAGFAKDERSWTAESMRTFSEKAIASGEVWGLVTEVGDRDGILSAETSGLADIDTKRPMTADTLFWIASMTKPVTGVAVMMLAEQGKLSVDDPVAKYLPEFKELKDAAGLPATITIANCLSHTAGLQELSKDEEKSTGTLAELAAITAKRPVKFPAGTKWVYSQTGINVAARIVEVVSGESYPEYLQKRLFGPLGMKDTTFYPTGEQLARRAIPYEKKDGLLSPAASYFPDGKPSPEKTNYPRANGGLFSTAGDYSKFARMLLRGGELDGHRYLKAETVAMMTKARTVGLDPAFVPGTFYGLACAVIDEPGGATAGLSRGSFGHGGVYGTQAWIDPVKGRYSVLMVQRANFGNGDASELRRLFQDAAAR
jgi:CubicO group peptidase (beta-lactamase class C family)